MWDASSRAGPPPPMPPLSAPELKVEDGGVRVLGPHLGTGHSSPHVAVQALQLAGTADGARFAVGVLIVHVLGGERVCRSAGAATIGWVTWRRLHRAAPQPQVMPLPSSRTLQEAYCDECLAAGDELKHGVGDEGLARDLAGGVGGGPGLGPALEAAEAVLA